MKPPTKHKLEPLFRVCTVFFKDSSTFQGIYTTLKAFFITSALFLLMPMQKTLTLTPTDLWITWVMCMDETTPVMKIYIFFKDYIQIQAHDLKNKHFPNSVFKDFVQTLQCCFTASMSFISINCESKCRGFGEYPGSRCWAGWSSRGGRSRLPPGPACPPGAAGRSGRLPAPGRASGRRCRSSFSRPSAGWPAAGPSPPAPSAGALDGDNEEGERSEETRQKGSGGGGVFYLCFDLLLTLLR